MDTYPLRLILAGVLLAPAPAPAIDFVVNTTADAVDAAIDGTCADAQGRCTLRAAIQEGNSTPAVDDTIQLPAGVYKLTVTGAFEDSAASGDLDISAVLWIYGAGASTTIIQGKKDRVFDVFATSFSAEDVTITKGKAPKSEEDEEASGGGIRNRGNLVLTRVTLARNQAADDSGAITNIAGAIALNQVTLSGNKAKDDAGAMDNDGGTILLSNVTFSKNKAKDEAGAFESEEGGTIDGHNVTVSGNKAREAGGVNAEQDGIVTLTNATITGNKAKEGGGGVQLEDDGSLAELALTNSIVSNNKRVNCSGPIATLGGNLDSGTSCGFSAPADQEGVANVGIAAKIALIGGQTPVHELLEASPAIDFAIDAECLSFDQRGAARVDVPAVGSTVCDSGAVEFVPPS
jgi:CSLREA domain-containing protein